jgi:hypothetical protein
MNHVRKGNNVLLIFGEHGPTSEKEKPSSKRMEGMMPYEMWMLMTALSLQNIVGWKILCKDFDWGSQLKLSNIEITVLKSLQHLSICQYVYYFQTFLNGKKCYNPCLGFQ